MSKKIFLAVLMMMSLPFCCLQVSAAPAPVGLEVGYTDPEEGSDPPQRGPVLVPEVGIEDYTLTFSTPCYGYTVELQDEDGYVVYTTIVTSDTLVLPSTLEGEYQLRLYPTGSSIYFYGEITL